MSLKITQHHTADHNWLRDGILAESTRLATPVDIGGPYHLGDPAHIQEHNRTTLALQTLADAAGCAVTLPPERKLGDTGHEGDHLAWEQALAQIQITEGWNDATGGTVSEYSDSRGFRWRLHTFTQSGTFTVKRGLRPFRVLAVAGGGGGGHGWAYYAHGGQGGNGQAIDQNLTLAAGDFAVTVGGADQPTTFATLTAEQGGHGGDGYDGGGKATDGAAGKRHDYVTSDITGKAVQYSAADGAYAPAAEPGGPGEFPGGGGGGGGGATNDLRPSREGGAGGAGVVYVAYQVAPYNEATGGVTTEYAKDGKRFRVHTFTQSDTLNVQVAAAPFQVLVVGGGGGSGGAFSGTGGSGGGGAVVEKTVRLTAGANPVTVGLGGPGGDGAGHHDTTNGGPSVFAGITAGGGGAGGCYFDGNQGNPGEAPNGGHGGNWSPTFGEGNSYDNPNVTSSITGLPVVYGVGGGWVDGTGGQTMPPGRGLGGQSHRGGSGDMGGTGVVIVSYEIGN